MEDNILLTIHLSLDIELISSHLPPWHYLEFTLLKQWGLKHTGNVVRMSFFQLRQLKAIRNCIPLDTAKTLVNAFVVTRLDYCNSLLAGVPSCQLERLQSVFNAAARLVCRAPRYDHITPLLFCFVAESKSLSNYVWWCTNLSTMKRRATCKSSVC